ncbi:MAG: hypothetical protein GVY19_00280 [Bacteroidetes bacterium]|jgi:hypothetical protein|nr:hypothetical protein [Bacteroidota bacterium]
MRKRTILVFLWVLFVLSGCENNEINLFISTNGTDTNPGTIDQPYRTLSKAAEQIQKVRNNNQQKIINVYLRQGIYKLDSSFTLNSLHNKSNDAPVKISQYQEENVRIIGGHIIENHLFEKANARELPPGMNRSGNLTGIYKCDLNQLNIDDLGEIQQFGFSTSIKPSQAQLYYNHKPLTIARYPNKSSMAIGEIIDKGPVPFNNDFTQEGGTFKYFGNRPNQWANENDIWIYGTFSGAYTDNNVQVKQIDTVQRNITTVHPEMFGYKATDSTSEWSRGARSFYAYNIPGELDMPGEYYIDKENNTLYVIPPDQDFDKEIAISMITDPLVTIEDASNITFSGIDFEYGRGMGICIVNGENNKIRDCKISNFGTLGIMFGKGVVSPEYPIHEMTGTLQTGIVGNIKAHVYENNDFYNYAGKNNTIENCVLRELGSGGIILSGGDRKSLTSGNNRVINCEIYNFTHRNKTYSPGIGLYGVGNQIKNCHIHNGPQQAIAVQGNEHLITLNIIENMTRNTHDNGSIYIGRNPTERGIVISHNLFYNIGKPGRKACSVHLDDCASGIRVFGNIFFRGSRSDFGDILLNGGNDNHLNNNIFINGSHALWIENPYLVVKHEYDERMEEDGLWFKRLYKEIDFNTPAWKSKYPELSSYSPPLDTLPFLKNNTFNNNLLINTPLVISKHGLDTSVFSTAKGNHIMEDKTLDIESKTDVLKDWLNTMAKESIKNFETIPVRDIGLKKY